jgi:small subunit ribosomal protein S13
MADDKTKEAKPEKDEKKTAPAEADEKGLSPDAKKKAKKDAEKAKKGEGEKKVKKVDYGPDFKYIVRIANTDLDGTKSVILALQGVKGIGKRIAPVVADHAGVPRQEKIGKLADAQIEGLVKSVDDIAAYVPNWAVNHPFDWESGQDLHLIGSNVDILLRDDINRLKKIRSYRGLRHELGQKVRGQRTRSNGRTGLTVGVSRIKAVEGEKKEEGAAPAAPAAGGKPAAAPAGGAKPAAPAAGGKPAAAPAGGKPAAPAGGAKPAAKPEGGKK